MSLEPEPQKASEPTQREPTSPETSEIGRAISMFIEHTDSLHSTFFLSRQAIEQGHESAFASLRAYVDQHVLKERHEDGHIERKIKPNDAHHVKSLLKQVARSESSLELVPRSFVVALVSEFDAFLGRLLKVLFVRRPELLASSERTLTLAELLKVSDLKTARDSLLDKEVEAVIRKSHDEQFDFLENRLNIPLRKDLPAWSRFIEVTERRNLFVHANGIVSEQYLRVCRQHNVECGDVVVGATLGASNEYFVQAYNCIYEIGVKLGHVIWRKFFASERESADHGLNWHCIDLIVEGHYQLAAALLDFACDTLKKHHSESLRLMLVINQAQAYKWMGDEARCEQILGKEDWTACEHKFVLAVHVLRQQYEEAARLVRTIGPRGGITEGQYESWPVFRDFRKSGLFLDAYREVFGRDFTTVEQRLRIGEDGQISAGREASSADLED